MLVRVQGSLFLDGLSEASELLASLWYCDKIKTCRPCMYTMLNKNCKVSPPSFGLTNFCFNYLIFQDDMLSPRIMQEAENEAFESD